MVDTIHRSCGRWSNFSLFPAAKTILINSSLLSILTYCLSVYPIPDSILSVISKLMRRFFWSWDINGKGIHNVTWCYLTEGKAEGGIGIKDLSIAKQSLMAKHMFKYLNRFNAIWVDICWDLM